MPNPVKMTVLESTNDFHKVCAVVRQGNFGHGSSVSLSSEQRKQLGIEGDYQAGHILAKMLGGSGSDLNNVVPMQKTHNNGAYKENEFDVRKFIKQCEEVATGKQVEARITFTIYYRPNQGQQTRIPNRIKFDTVMYTDGKEGVSYTGDFNNLERLE